MISFSNFARQRGATQLLFGAPDPPESHAELVTYLARQGATDWELAAAAELFHEWVQRVDYYREHSDGHLGGDV